SRLHCPVGPSCIVQNSWSPEQECQQDSRTSPGKEQGMFELFKRNPLLSPSQRSVIVSMTHFTQTQLWRIHPVGFSKMLMCVMGTDFIHHAGSARDSFCPLLYPALFTGKVL